MKTKICNSKGKIHNSCPYIDRIQDILGANHEKFSPEDLIEINQKLEMVRTINAALREYLQPAEPYNFAAVIKRLKAIFPNDAEKINEIIKQYY